MPYSSIYLSISIYRGCTNQALVSASSALHLSHQALVLSITHTKLLMSPCTSNLLISIFCVIDLLYQTCSFGLLPFSVFYFICRIRLLLSVFYHWTCGMDLWHRKSSVEHALFISLLLYQEPITTIGSLKKLGMTFSFSVTLVCNYVTLSFYICPTWAPIFLHQA